jgi:hypothetical protein
MIDEEKSLPASDFIFTCIQDIADEIRERRHNRETLHGGRHYQEFLRMRSERDQISEIADIQYDYIDRLFLRRW